MTNKQKVQNYKDAAAIVIKCRKQQKNDEELSNNPEWRKLYRIAKYLEEQAYLELAQAYRSDKKFRDIASEMIDLIDRFQFSGWRAKRVLLRELEHEL